MPTQTIGPIKLKNKPGKKIRRIANRDNSPLVLRSILLYKDPKSTSGVILELDSLDPDKYDIVEVKKKEK